MRTVIFAIVALALLAIGAVGGFFYGQTVGQAQANDIRNNFLASRGINAGGQGGAAQAGGVGGQAGQTGQGGGFAGQGGQGRGTFGSIKDVAGNTINLSTANAAVKVTVTDQTQIQRTVQQPMQLSELQSGENVVVTGDQDSQGNITARSINIVPQGAFGGRQGAGASGTPGANATPAAGGQGGQGGNRGGGRPGANGTPGAAGGQGGAAPQPTQTR
ncbi:MAG: DUF5666 domain-containing protein [Anaerolineae bacterium]